MSQTGSIAPAPNAASLAVPWRAAYRAFAYFGLFSLVAAPLYGFRYGPSAAEVNYLWNGLLYAAFIAPHLVMTRSWFKRAVWKNPAGTPAERRVYITVSTLTWLAVVWLQWPMPGPSVVLPAWVNFAGVVLYLVFVTLFFEGLTRPMIDGFLGVPGASSAFSHGPDTPLFTEGQFAKVRHPMYRAFILAGLSSLLVHPHASQLFWLALICGTFIAFIPVEEAQMIRARGEDYRRYMQQTRWRLFRGVW